MADDDEKKENKESGKADGKKNGKGKNAKTEKIRLMHGDVKIHDYKISVKFEALVIGENGKIKPDCPITFYGRNFNDLNKNKKLTTNKQGKKEYEFTAPISDFGKTAYVRVQIDNSPAEASAEVKLEPSLGKGMVRFLHLVRYNIGKKWHQLIVYTLKTLTFMGIPYLLLRFMKLETSFLIGIFLACVSMYILRKKIRIGSAIAASIISMSYWCPVIFTHSLRYAAEYTILAGLFFYWLEEATYDMVVDPGNGKVKIEWERWFNFYPKIPIGIAFLGIFWNILILLYCLIGSGGTGAGIQPGTIIDLAKYSPTTNFTSSMAGSYLINIFDYIMATLVLLLYATPGEFLSMFNHKTETVGTGRMVERFLFIKEITDIIRRVTGRTA